MAFWPPVDCLSIHCGGNSPSEGISLLWRDPGIFQGVVFRKLSSLSLFFFSLKLSSLKKKKNLILSLRRCMFSERLAAGTASGSLWWEPRGFCLPCTRADGGKQGGVELAGVHCSSVVSSRGISSVFTRSSWGMCDVSVSHGWETNQPTSCVWNFLRNSGRLGCFSLVSFWELTVG